MDFLWNRYTDSGEPPGCRGKPRGCYVIADLAAVCSPWNNRDFRFMET